MAQFVRKRKLLALFAALVGASSTAVVAHADPLPETVSVTADVVVPVRILDREVNAHFLPQLRKTEHASASASRRPPKPSTLLQLDARVGEESDLMFRVQARQKQFLFLEFRF